MTEAVHCPVSWKEAATTTTTSGGREWGRAVQDGLAGSSSPQETGPHWRGVFGLRSLTPTRTKKWSATKCQMTLVVTWLTWLTPHTHKRCL